MIQFQHGIINALEFDMSVAGAGDLPVSAFVVVLLAGVEVHIPALFNDVLGKYVAEIPVLPVEENAAHQIFTEVRIGQRFYRPYADTCMFIKPIALDVTPPVVVFTAESVPLIADAPVAKPKPFRPVVEKVEPPKRENKLVSHIEQKRKQADAIDRANNVAASLGESLKSIATPKAEDNHIEIGDLTVKPSLTKK